MDNASKALIIAGGMLVAIAIISVTLYMFAQARDLADTSDQILEQSQIQAFNRFYYAYAPVLEREYEISGLDACNIYNKVSNNNLDKEYGDYQYITIRLLNELTAGELENSVNFTKTYHIRLYADSDGLINEIQIY